MKLYDFLVHAGYPLRRWARLEVAGLQLVPRQGPVVIVSNHDSMLDPVALIGACHPRRYLRFLAMAELWRNPLLRLVLDRLRQIPTERGPGGERAIDHAVRALQDGEAIVIFPEGGLSGGGRPRARRGVGQLIAACPQVPLVLAAVTGAPDGARFPKRPRVRVAFVPGGRRGGPAPGAVKQAELLVDQIRGLAPPAPAGRQGRLARRLRERRIARRRARA